MHKYLLLFLIILFSGCSSNLPVNLYAEKINIFPPTKPHTPEINGVLEIKTFGYIEQIFYDTHTKDKPTTFPNKLSPIEIKTLPPIKDDFNNIVIPKIFKYETKGSGSGFIAAKQNGYYYVITAKHIIMANLTKVLIDGHEGQHVESMKKVDAAILKFKSDKEYPIYKFGEAKFMEDAWIVGFPGSIDKKIRKFTIKGHICSVPKKHEIWFAGGGAHGMSGGILLNNKNEALGVISKLLTTKRYCDNFVCSTPPQFFKFALKVILLKEQIKLLTEKINILKQSKSD